MDYAPLLISLIAIYIAIRLIANKGRRLSKRRSKAAPAPVSMSPVFHWPKLDQFEFDVVGESFYADHLSALVKGIDPGAELECTAVLVPENDNPHDPMAVSVWIGGGKVGHLSRSEARSFRRRLASKKLGKSTTSCDAVVCRGFDGSERHSVRLDIKPFEV